MHADLSRWMFRPERHYSRVVAQQGRVSLDADANAQARSCCTTRGPWPPT